MIPLELIRKKVTPKHRTNEVSAILIARIAHHGITRFCLRSLYQLLLLTIGVSLAATTDAKEPPFALPNSRELLTIKSALIETSAGPMVFELFPAHAPWHVANFKYLADKGYYAGTSFTIYEPGYITQGGLRPGEKNAPYSLPPEFSTIPHTSGVLGMARRPDFVNSQRRSDGHQFHIILGNAQHMDGNYTIFGRLIRGFNTLSKVRRGTKIERIVVYVRERDDLNR